MSGTQWIHLRGIDCFERLAIGILVPADGGGQTEQGTLSLRVSNKGRGWRESVESMERMSSCNVERKKKKKKKKRQGGGGCGGFGNKAFAAVISACDF